MKTYKGYGTIELDGDHLVNHREGRMAKLEGPTREIPLKAVSSVALIPAPQRETSSRSTATSQGVAGAGRRPRRGPMIHAGRLSLSAALCHAASLFAVLLILGLTAGAAAAQSIAVPAYFYPGGNPDYWSQLDQAGPGALAVMNPNSGPGSAPDTNYVSAVKSAEAAGITVVGYVYTSYGSRSLGAVESDVDKYYSWYPVEGIFFDQASTSCATEPYYAQLNSYVKAKGGLARTVLNPGTQTNQCYASAADTLLTFEGSDSEYVASYSAPSWVSSYPASHFWHVVYGTSTTSAMATAVQLSKTRNAGYVYVTSATLPNPYDLLPTGLYWSSELADIGATVALSAPTNTAVPIISGSPNQGQVLTTTTGSWTGNPTPTYTYQWQDCNSTGGSCTNISGATSSIYTAASSDVGRTIVAVVTATNSQGQAAASSAATAVVQAALAPTVVTGGSSQVGTTSATVAGTVNPNGQATTYHFDYGTTTNYGSQAPGPPDPSAGSGTTSQNESTGLSGLSPGTMYHYRIEATNASGTTYGSDQTFTTSPAGPIISTAPQGNWVGTYGGSGYDLAGWNGGSDVTVMPGVSASLVGGSRYVWAAGTSDVRALQSADKSSRNAATYYGVNQFQVQLSFTSAYSGNLELYAVDWDTNSRRETITVGNQTAILSSDFSQGAWITLPIDQAANSTLTITVSRTAGVNAVLSGIFLG